MTRVAGDTQNLKASQARALRKLGERRVPADRVVSAALARDLLDLSHELNRRVGLFIDRRGRVESVILGDAHAIELPEFARVRGVDGRLRGVRLVSTHLVADRLDREELADLTKLRLDLVCAVHRGPAGITCELASLTPAVDRAFTTRTWSSVPLAVLLKASEGDPLDDVESRSWPDLPAPLEGFLRELEASLQSSSSSSTGATQGTRAMVLMVHAGGREAQARKAEIAELAKTAGIALVEVVEQRRPHPDPRTFLGSGKLREVLVRALEQDVEVLICDPDLSASQARTVTNLTDLKVIDRTMLILDIFAQHAKSSDGKLQVELAQLRYRLPRMVGKGTMMSRLMGGVGGRGPGETKLEVDRRRARQRVTDLERRLKNMRKQREQRRSRRRRSEVPVVAIVGYTNAGKSTLLNAITGSDVLAEDKLFATLDPTVRRIRFPLDREIVLLDTVGFIRDLPPALVQAFAATLEEIADADLLVHVVDAADPDRRQQIEAVQEILGELGASEVPCLRVYNKTDQLSENTLALRHEEAPSGTLFVSAVDRRTTRGLISALEERLWAAGKFERDDELEITLDDAESPEPSDAEDVPDASDAGAA